MPNSVGITEPCEVYEDGSWYCEGDWGWEYQDAYGNYSYGLWDSQGNAVDSTGRIVAVGDIISSVFGGGQRGYYAPDRSDPAFIKQQQRGYRPYDDAVTANVGANRGGIGAGLNISTNTLMLIVGGVLIFMLGSGRSRR